jgi:hypothetical protein
MTKPEPDDFTDYRVRLELLIEVFIAAGYPPAKARLIARKVLLGK